MKKETTNKALKRFGPQIIILGSVLVFALYASISLYYTGFRANACAEATGTAYRFAVKESLEQKRAHCVVCHRVRP